jgi:hypothetical protein
MPPLAAAVVGVFIVFVVLVGAMTAAAVPLSIPRA